jgi:sulfatase maturation enzyme AslB (radical SAM superfamily)
MDRMKQIDDITDKLNRVWKKSPGKTFGCIVMDSVFGNMRTIRKDSILYSQDDDITELKLDKAISLCGTKEDCKGCPFADLDNLDTELSDTRYNPVYKKGFERSRYI